MTTKAERAALADLDAVRKAYRGRAHPIVPVDVAVHGWSTTGRCAVCGRPVYESGDYRGGRFRHATVK